MDAHNKILLIDIGHPANVHLFKYTYQELVKKGWQVCFSVVDKEVTVELLKAYCLPYLIIGNNRKGLIRKIVDIILLTFRFNLLINRMKPCIILSRGSVHASIVAFVRGIAHLVFSDTESAGFVNQLSYLLADYTLTSTAFELNFGKKQIRYPGYHELAYLHPKRFLPDVGILEKLGLASDEKYAIVRFVSWSAHHDIGQNGMSPENKVNLIKELSKHMKVFISSESELPEELAQYQITIKPELMHDALFYAYLLIGESATMASECAMLGTPAIFINNNQLGCIYEQAQYRLIHQYDESELGQKKSISKAVKIAKNDDIKKEYIVLRNRMLEEKIDVTAFMVWLVDNYPTSMFELKNATLNFARFQIKP